MNELEINGKKYVLKSSVKPEKVKSKKGMEESRIVFKFDWW